MVKRWPRTTPGRGQAPPLLYTGLAGRSVVGPGDITACRGDPCGRQARCLRRHFMPQHSRPPVQTYMLQEIQEQPAALRRTLSNTSEPARQVALEAQQRGVELVILAARGTSDHAALYAQYLFQYLNGIPVALATPSLYTLYGASLRLGRALVIGISQSGESTDIVEVVGRAREMGALTVGITNQEGSQLAITAQHSLLCHAGLERSVVATKT